MFDCKLTCVLRQVASVAEKEVTRNPQPPFITSTLQQDASAKVGLSPSTTMQLAQQLYEGPAEAAGEVLATLPLQPSAGAVLQPQSNAHQAHVLRGISKLHDLEVRSCAPFANSLIALLDDLPRSCQGQ